MHTVAYSKYAYVRATVITECSGKGSTLVFGEYLTKILQLLGTPAVRMVFAVRYHTIEVLKVSFLYIILLGT